MTATRKWKGDGFEHEVHGMKWIWANFAFHAVVLWNGSIWCLFGTNRWKGSLKKKAGME
jgi:hypothetical protein